MPELSPFPGIRYDCDVLGTEVGALVAPPYDVIDEEHRAALEARDPHNAVRLILPRDAERDGDRYDRAAAALQQWRSTGALATDPGPRFYVYRMDYQGPAGEPRRTLGVLGALGLPAAGDGSVLPHERTLPKAKSDRLALLRATRANFDPIWGLSLTSGLTELLDDAAPLARCFDEGVEHTLLALDDPERVAAVSEAVAASPLVLADGHHRFETALAYREELRAAGAEPGGAGAIMAFVVELADDQLCIEAIHRLLSVPAGLDLRAALADAFDVRPAGPNTPEAVDELLRRMGNEGGIGLVDDAGLALLVPSEPALAPQGDAVASTDAALVERAVLPRLDGVEVTYRHDAAACAGMVGKRLAGAALLLRPVSVAGTRAAAEAGARMPQKTTFFWPKPRTGLVFRALDA